MSGMARVNLTGRIDAIAYRSRGPETFYVAEYASSVARGRQLDVSLRNLIREVRKDVGLGLYSLPKFRLLRTFVTLNTVTLQLREGTRYQGFTCRIDEVEDARGKRFFEASCPTNYLRDSGKTIPEAMAGLTDIIQARYAGEGVHDLIREMPKCPIMTAVDISPDTASRWGAAVISRSMRGYQACITGSSVSAHGHTPVMALSSAEGQLADLGNPFDTTLAGEPVFCAVDVPLALQEGTSIHRFLVTISSQAGNGSSFFTAHAPQIGDLSIKASSFDVALRSISDAIALELSEQKQAAIKDLLRRQIILATVKLPS